MQPSKPQHGFSLIELLIAMAVMMVLAAISVPHLTRARISANEAAAVSNLRTVQSAETAYSIAYPDQGYTCSWSELGPPLPGQFPSPHSAGLIDESLVKAKKNGYSYQIKDCGGQLPLVTYTLAASPEVEGTTGILFFCANESGVMHYINVEWASGCITKGVPLLEKANPSSADDYSVATSSSETSSK